MAEPASISTGIAARYGAAVFELAQEAGALDALAGDVDTLGAALSESADLRALISSPVVSRAEQGAAMAAVARAAGVSDLTTRTLGLMATKRRLFILPHLLARLAAALAEARGEVTAEVRSAKPLTRAQAERLSATLAASVGRKIKLSATIDETLIGGLVVKVGSKMIDTTIRSKLSTLQNSMKEVG